MTIVDIVATRATSESLAYVFLADGTPTSELRWSFADTASRARAYAAHLRERGIGAGHRVVLAVNPSLDYIAALVRRTREWPSFSIGASPRAGVAILRGARAAAALEGRDYVVPDDVIEVALPALRHRVILTPEAEIEGRKIDDLLAELIRSVEVPRK